MPATIITSDCRGVARGATGWLGNFSVTVDQAAAASPASRTHYLWGEGKNGTTSRCDVLLDLTGRAPLFPSHEVRQGYLRADPRDAAMLGAQLARIQAGCKDCHAKWRD